MSFVVKISYKGDVRRGRFSSIADVSFEDISCMVTESFGLSTYIAKYKDEEGDWCTATPKTFSDALELSATTNVLRLDIMVEPDPETCSCTSESPSTCSWEEVNFPGELDDSDTETDAQLMPTSSQEQAETLLEDCAASHPCLNLAGEDDILEPHHTSQKMPAVPQEEAVTVSEDSAPCLSCLNLAAEDQTVESHNNSRDTPTLPEERVGALSEESAASHERPHLEETGEIAESRNNSQVISTCPQELELVVTADSTADSSFLDLQESGHIVETHTKSPCSNGFADSTADVAAQQEAANPTEGYAAPPRAITHSWYASDEKIQIVLAAFDANGDGRLNYEESNELQEFASGDHMPLEVYQTICAELRVAESQGPGTQELEILYEKYDTLQRDFEAALRKIESGTERQEGMASQSSSEVWRGSLERFLRLPLAGLCPVTVGAAAVLNHMARSKG